MIPVIFNRPTRRMVAELQEWAAQNTYNPSDQTLQNLAIHYGTTMQRLRQWLTYTERREKLLSDFD